MKKFLRLFAQVLVFLSLASFGLSHSVRAQSTPPTNLPAVLGAVKTDHVEAELVSRDTTWSPGSTITLGLRLKHDLHWHTYWRNPGDSGLATQFQWAFPSGWSTPEVLWPTPQRIGVAHLANYGYEGEIVLPIKVKVPEAGAQKTSRIQVFVQWLVCKDVCIPGEAHLAVEGQVGVADPSKPASAFESLFEKASASLPKAPQLIGKVKFEPNAVNSRVLLDIQLPVNVIDAINSAKKVEFFPYVEGWIRPAAEQNIRLNAAALQLEMSTSELAFKPPTNAQPIGVLQADRQFYEVQATFIETAPTQIGSIEKPNWVSRVEYHVDLKSSKAKPSLLDPNAGGSLGGRSATGSAQVASGSAVAAFPGIAGQDKAQLGLLLALAFAFLGGMILNLMPCVLPVLSIKLLGLVPKDGPAINQAIVATSVKREGTWFAIGVTLSFVALGLLLWGLRAAGESIGWGFQLQSPSLVYGLALLFFALSLNLFGVFELGTRASQLANLVPSSATAQNQSNVVGPNLEPNSVLRGLGSGVLAVIAASPCSAPFMGSALGYALGQPVHETLLVFLFLGLGMAFPIWLLTRNPSWLRWLPKPGAWMGAVKQLLAFPLLATVAWLLWVFVLQTSPEALLKALLALVVLACFFWLLGARQMQRTSFAKTNFVSRWVLAALLVWLSVGAISESNSTQQTAQGSKSSVSVGEITWQPFSPTLLNESLAQQRAVMIDFTAAWCVSCQVNKQAVLETSAAKALFAKNKVVLLKADWTKRDPVISQALASYGRNAVPLYVVYKAGSNQPILLPEILTMTNLRDSFER